MIRLPWVSRAQANLHEQRRVAELEGLRYYIRSCEATIKDGRAHSAKLIDTLQQLRGDLHSERLARDEDRRQYAGDLQLERQRFEEFARDYLDKLTAGPQRGAPTSPAEQIIPGEVEEAIQDFAGPDRGLASVLQSRASALLRRGEKPDVVAEKIRKGESPQ